MGNLALARPRSDIIIEGEFPFRARDFDRIAAMIREQSGIALQESKAALVYSRLAKRLRAIGCATFEAYLELVCSPKGGDERMAMLAALTTNYTSFFREQHHFDYLRGHAFPGLIKRARDGGKVRIWSAACSTGEEPYSIALTLLDMFPEAARHDIRILATDIDHKVVATAKAGLYREETVAAVPLGLRNRWLEREEGGQRVKDEVKALLSFRELNLIGEWPMRGKFDLLFCRNVVIYFEDATQARLWTRFRDYLAPEGRLFIGHSERIDVPGYESDGLTIYKHANGRQK
jgi:chemotaxis protein methyltransferase CheR